MNTAVIVALVLAAIAAWWWFVGRNQPAFPPLDIADDDPLMEQAKVDAKASISRFLELLSKNPGSGRVKVPFASSSGETEFLWAKVQSVEGDALEVLYLTPPVTHAGRVERLNRHLTTDLVDWLVELPDGTYAGGYTMRVMFVRGRQQWGALPRELQEEERKYVGG